MEIDYVALRKLIAGVVLFFLASGVEGKPWLKTLLKIGGVILIAGFFLYQFNIIPEDKTDLLIQKIQE